MFGKKKRSSSVVRGASSLQTRLASTRACRLAFEPLEDRRLLSVVTWTGAVDSNWNMPGNWSPSGVPANGSDLVFPAGTGHLSTNNNISGISFNTITINDNYTLAGNAFTLSNSLNTITVGSTVGSRTTGATISRTLP